MYISKCLVLIKGQRILLDVTNKNLCQKKDRDIIKTINLLKNVIINRNKVNHIHKCEHTIINNDMLLILAVKETQGKRGHKIK